MMANPLLFCGLSRFLLLLETMEALVATGLQAMAAKTCVSSPRRMLTSRTAISGSNLKVVKQSLANSPSSLSLQPLRVRYPSPSKCQRFAIRAMSGESEKETAYGLPIDLRGIYGSP